MVKSSQSPRDKKPERADLDAELTKEFADWDAKVLAHIEDPENNPLPNLSPRNPNPRDRDQLSWPEVRGWFTPPFMETAFRLKKSKHKTTHRLGGHGPSPTPQCGGCGTALVLFADLDATDGRLRGDHPFTRLPLFYCCSCPGPIYYCVDQRDISVIASPPDRYEEAPFNDPPTALPPGFLSLESISAEMEGIIETVFRKQDGYESLTRGQKQSLNELLGRRSRMMWDPFFSQLGGFLTTYQGGESLPDICPNTGCPFRRRKKKEFKYRPLAVLDLWSDHFWGITPADAVQIVYSVCPGCFCIAAKYTCT